VVSFHSRRFNVGRTYLSVLGSRSLHVLDLQRSVQSFSAVGADYGFGLGWLSLARLRLFVWLRRVTRGLGIRERYSMVAQQKTPIQSSKFDDPFDDPA
jgi:hypothetical protein